jgi:hypothetical protein
MSFLPVIVFDGRFHEVGKDIVGIVGSLSAICHNIAAAEDRFQSVIV